MQKNKINRIVVVGGGTAGWMTAAALSKILGTQHYSITLIESEEVGTVGVGEATIPMINLYNGVLGLDEDEFVRETSATFKLGIHFADWKNIGDNYFHPFGLYGIDMDGINFHNFWLRWVKEGGNQDLGRFNAETEAARVNKFTRTGNDPNATLPRVNYAFQFDASQYAAFLRRFSEKRGAVRVEGFITQVHQNAQTGYIESLELKDGRKIEGDLFVDCSGFRGLLIEQTLEAGYHDWSHWLPANRAAAVQCSMIEEPVPYTRATAREAGWQWRIPLQHRTGNGYVFCNDYISEDEAASKLLERLDGKPLTDPKILRFVTGYRKKCWVKNCVAMGLSSGFLEPLESTSIHLVQVSIAKLLSHFPKNEFIPSIVEKYNREMEYEYESIRDFLIAHYKITEREDTPFWKYCKNMDIPESLEVRMEHFLKRGEVMATTQELFKETNWFAIMYYQGMRPVDYHPVADVVSEDELRTRMARIRTSVQDRVNGMPLHKDFIKQNCAAKRVQMV